MEAAVGKGAVVAENLAPGLVDGFTDIAPHGHREALIALAVVVGTHVEEFVILMVEPLADFDEISRLRLRLRSR